MDRKELLNEALTMSKWEKIDSGVHVFTISNVETRLTDKSKRQAIVYSGTIKNSKGLDQIVNVVDLVDSDDGFKFGASRLIQFINYFGGNAENVETLEDLIDNAREISRGKTIKLEFVKKIVNGATIREKVFVLNR